MPDRPSTIAAIYDIHGNLPALEAVLATIDERGIETIVVGGDVVLGPMPRECLERLIDLGSRVRFVRGNCDRLVVDAFDGRELGGLPSAVQETIRWTARQLGRTHRDALAAFPKSVTSHAGGLGDVFFCHATARSDDEIFTVRSSDSRVRPMFAGVDQRIIVCGHTHMPFIRLLDEARLVNAGSVGMPYGGVGAHWLMLGGDITPVTTDYALEAAADRIRATSYPGAEAFARDFVLASPDADRTVELFEGGT